MTTDPTTPGQRWLDQITRQARQPQPRCRSCGHKWYGFRDVDCRPICATCGSPLTIPDR